MTGFSDALRKSAHAAHSLRVMVRAGMMPDLSVSRAVGALKDVRLWGPLVSSVRYCAQQNPHAHGLVDERGPLAYGELDRRSNALACAFQERGFQAGQTIAILCRDNRWMIDTLLACGKLGIHTLLINTGFAAPQLADVMRREQADAIVHDEEFAELVLATHLHLPRFVAWSTAPDPDATALEDLITTTVVRPLPSPPEHASVILLTSGTTGRPKGARREVRSGFTASGFLERIPLRARESTFIASPMFHAIGYSQLVVGFALGSTVVVHRRFEAEAVAQSIHRQQCSALILVPTMLQRLLELDDEFLRESLRSLGVVLTSGSPLSPALCAQTREVLGNVLYNLYGSTEAAVVSVATPGDLRLAPGTVGRAPRGCTLRLLDEAGRPVTRAHVPGRIFAGGPLTFSGYTDGHPGDLSGDLVATGDLGHFDDAGRLFVDGRADDMIVSGGENVFPSEVENLISKHYQVKDVAVVGVPDREFGQRLRAFVVPVQGCGLTSSEIRDYVRASLAKHKVPREVIMVGTVPRNATGKILRSNLMNPLSADQ